MEIRFVRVIFHNQVRCFDILVVDVQTFQIFFLPSRYFQFFLDTFLMLNWKMSFIFSNQHWFGKYAIFEF